MTRLAMHPLAVLLFCNLAMADEQVPRFLAGRVPVDESRPVPPEHGRPRKTWSGRPTCRGWAGRRPSWGDRVVLTTCVNTGHDARAAQRAVSRRRRRQQVSQAKPTSTSGR